MKNALVKGTHQKLIEDILMQGFSLALFLKFSKCLKQHNNISKFTKTLHMQKSTKPATIEM